ncbi:helix-turn-helix domain-containing protein [Pseudotenacibaculum haliotis]|uniref:Helix-turn-helix domain-containing protein n=1 Tax=Pseudotenacibaculum haliotis TaxID=1862138 RepID=A0ABW5LV71_9FLAO
MSIDRDLIKIQKAFGERVRELRVKKGLSQFDLASHCNYEKSTISRIENGRTNITLKTALNLSSKLEVKLKDLFEF